MNEFRTDKGVYRTEDFYLWYTQGMLELSPKFQRRSVWKPAAKSFLIDTILREMTVPPIYLRLTQKEKSNSTVRQVVDGQQRIRTVIEFIDGTFRLGKLINPAWTNKSFSELSDDEQRRINTFGFTTETFGGISDPQVLEIFCRLNTNGIPLNQQELRNGKYFGHFKQLAYSLAYEYLQFWTSHRMFTDLSIARMQEVQLTSELLVAGMHGMQDKKKSIDDCYRDFEDTYQHRDRDQNRFHNTMQAISETFGADGLKDSEFRRIPLFYSLYCVVYHRLNGLPRVERLSARKKMSADERGTLRAAVESLSSVIFESEQSKGIVDKKYAKFIGACLRQTDNILPRKIRFDTLYDEAF